MVAGDIDDLMVIDCANEIGARLDDRRMITLHGSERNAAEAGVDNVEFLENIPVPDSSVDVVISNCVINLAADKNVVLAEAALLRGPELRPGLIASLPRLAMAAFTSMKE